MFDTIVSVGGLTLYDGPRPPREPDGSEWTLTRLGGWVAGGTTPRATAVDPGTPVDGVHDGIPTFGGRTVAIEGTVWTPDRATRRRAEHRIGAVLSGMVRRSALVVDEPIIEQSLQAIVRLSGETMAHPLGTQGVVFSLGLFAPDRTRYGSTLRSVSSGRATPGSELEIPLVVPIEIGPAGVSGFMTAVNDGNLPAWPVIRFVGPLVNPSIRLVGGPELVALTTLNPGEVLVLDASNRTVLLGGAQRRGVLGVRSKWFGLNPGDSSLLFSATSGTGTAIVEWRDAWT